MYPEHAPILAVTQNTDTCRYFYTLPEDEVSPKADNEQKNISEAKCLKGMSVE
jgi:hypothetical protein